MNYLLKISRCREDCLSVGLHRLSIALIYWMWLWSIFMMSIAKYSHNIIIEVLIRTILIYLFFRILILFISVGRYGFRQKKEQVELKTVKQKINCFYFFSFEQMGIKRCTLFDTLQKIGIICALLCTIPFVVLTFINCRFYLMLNPWADVGVKKFYDTRITSISELFWSLIFLIIVALLIYLFFILIAWVWSGFEYGAIQKEDKIIPLLFLNDLENCKRNIYKNFGKLNCYVYFGNQQKLIIKGHYESSNIYQIKIVAQDIIFVRGQMQWASDVSKDQFIQPNVGLDRDLQIIKSLAFYEGGKEVFLIAAEKISVYFLEI